MLQSVVTSSPNNARYVADKFGFVSCPASADELLEDESIDTIFIALVMIVMPNMC